MSKKRGMGLRGVNALIGGKQKTEANVSDMRIEKIAIGDLVPGIYQPRYKFAEEALNELADSIKVQGIVQPIIVKLVDGHYEIIAGERRWRAAKIAGLEKVPVVVRQADNQATLAMGLIENMQREDLNPIEVAVGLKRLMQEFELTQQEVADAVGRSRSGVTNLLRLLKLPEMIQEWLHDGLLTMGHARCIITFPQEIQLELAQKAIDRNWSVREIERAAQEILTPRVIKKKPLSEVQQKLLDRQTHISEKIGSACKIQHRDNGKGRLEINYSSLEDLERILQTLQLAR
ncbi:ParB/RepB/Spo0J family partition protein [Thiosulfativibrio zosterae]|uniref:Probable chromosome-partitioning protein ParB n=1 Tax=Thiosulfativibrio zosterae TaxID=2675053 RepID=A0A6F8PJW5_9GAMM|nr:ParB/RepB/Spo0J family partition protein [Thiosulfativibrio zosterae]BBP42392.1 chromosome partitioning protein ParB [Thiosulfativibrio zosterae]